MFRMRGGDALVAVQRVVGGSPSLGCARGLTGVGWHTVFLFGTLGCGPAAMLSLGCGPCCYVVYWISRGGVARRQILAENKETGMQAGEDAAAEYDEADT